MVLIFQYHSIIALMARNMPKKKPMMSSTINISWKPTPERKQNTIFM
jgi:hypothetical protein